MGALDRKIDQPLGMFGRTALAQMVSKALPNTLQYQERTEAHPTGITHFGPPFTLTSPGSRLPVVGPQQGEFVPQTTQQSEAESTEYHVITHTRTSSPNRPSNVHIVCSHVFHHIVDGLRGVFASALRNP
jgi:hypothetical protein